MKHNKKSALEKKNKNKQEKKKHTHIADAIRMGERFDGLLCLRLATE